MIAFPPSLHLSLVAVAALPELSLVLQAAGLGAALGSAVALRAQWRSASADTWRITTAWATLGLMVGALVVVVAVVG